MLTVRSEGLLLAGVIKSCAYLVDPAEPEQSAGGRWGQEGHVRS